MTTSSLLASLFSNHSCSLRTTSSLSHLEQNKSISQLARSSSVCAPDAKENVSQYASKKREIDSKILVLTERCSNDRAQIRQMKPLIKLVHFINVKMKKQKYFVFCRLEQITKNHTHLRQQNETKSPHFNRNIEENNALLTQNKLSPNNVVKNYSLRDSTLSAFAIKLSKEILIDYVHSFKKIHCYSNRLQASMLITKTIETIIQNNKRRTFHNLMSAYRLTAKTQLLWQQIKTLYIQKISKIFKCLRLCSQRMTNSVYKMRHTPSKATIIPLSRSIPSQPIQSSKMCKLSSLRNEIASKLSLLQDSWQTQSLSKTLMLFRDKKIVIRPASPISFPQGKALKLRFEVEQKDSDIILAKFMPQREEKIMTKLFHFHAEQKTTQLPDFRDHFQVFKTSNICFESICSGVSVEKSISPQIIADEEFFSARVSKVLRKDPMVHNSQKTKIPLIENTSIVNKKVGRCGKDQQTIKQVIRSTIQSRISRPDSPGQISKFGQIRRDFDILKRQSDNPMKRSVRLKKCISKGALQQSNCKFSNQQSKSLASGNSATNKEQPKYVSASKNEQENDRQSYKTLHKISEFNTNCVKSTISSSNSKVKLDKNQVSVARKMKEQIEALISKRNRQPLNFLKLS